MSDRETIKKALLSLCEGIPSTLPPKQPVRDTAVPHAPTRVTHLDAEEERLALKNALRYLPKEHHAEMAPELLQELRSYGHIYFYRLRPTEYPMQAYPLDLYPTKIPQAACIMLMIMNNLDPRVAQFPHELITYGGQGAVFSNWAQYRLVMRYLSEMTNEQTLLMYSGHPAGLFPSRIDAPRCVITNGMVIPNYSSKDHFDRMYALGVSQYGQMTAGSYCYIGPQGIVHGTVITVLNAGRKYLRANDLAGKVFVTAGLGGMSGAQGKAAVIAGAVAVVAEVSEEALMKRLTQGWIDERIDSLPECIARVRQARAARQPVSIAYLGNVVDLWEALANDDGELLVDLGSDQTSLHNPYNGGYYPAGLTFEESNRMMADDPALFKQKVQESLVRHVAAVNRLTSKGMKFWDYGNAFLLEAGRAGADIWADDTHKAFKYPSYVQDIMGDVFSLGFGPFRWVCASNDPNDLDTTDRLAAEVIAELAGKADDHTHMQYEDNLKWIRQAKANALVVGSQARILYSDAEGRVRIAQAFNKAVREGVLSAPVILSRDHHDVSGTDSPFRETSNIYDGSQFCADMAVQNFCGLGHRGATWIALHNGGGVGWGEVINGGFGMVLDGSDSTHEQIALMLSYDVNNGVARRAWAGNDNANYAIRKNMQVDPLLNVTLAHAADDSVLDQAFSS
eukprot:TRINITY_DN2774_c0_g2_i2.p1 TRINITY_DN2774_c0_g2~~TRINITY_DN2774_c0_g2_i2.p1  ORF type:complete len:679 (-),score=171.51 TRINITY_DN2774_c0_g2_i2:100-2136(-)